MTTAPRAPANALRNFPFGDPSGFADNPVGLIPEFRRRGFESCFAKPLFAGIPSLDETIEAGYGFCLNRATGIWPDGKQPTTVREPGTGTKFGSEPRGLSEVDALEKVCPGLRPAIRKRTDRCRALGTKSMAYVGGLPLNLFNGKTAAQRDAWLDAMVGWVKECGFDIVAFDLTAIDSQEWGKSPTMRLAERLIAVGVEVCINAQPYLCPGVFEWVNGRFGCVAEAGDNWEEKGVNAGLFLRPENTRFAIASWYLWIQGSVPVPDRLRLCATFPGAPIVDFAGMPDSWWKRAA